MKIMFLADVESSGLWDYFKKEDFSDIDLIVSCGDLKASYLSFLATMSGCEVVYVHGNHDKRYDEIPPEGCICIDDKVFEYKGIRFVGLGGSMRYKPGKQQYTEREMAHRIRKLHPKYKLKKGVDVFVTHAPAKGHNDGEDLCHTGFMCFHRFLEKYKPRYFVHGHVHLNYGRNIPRVSRLGDTTVINAYEKYILEIDERK